MVSSVFHPVAFQIKFRSTSLSNPCQFCGDIKGNCRHGDEIHLCMGLNSNRKFEIHNHHKIIGFTKDGLWAILKLDNSSSWNEEKLQEWLNERKVKEKWLAQKQGEKLKNLLSIDKRDGYYRKVLSKLNLSVFHTIQLKEKRGLSSLEIDFAYSKGWIRSWNRGQRVSVDGQLAGVNPSTHKLLGGDGIAIVATNGDQLITGFQIASDNRDKFAKYFWLSSANHGGNSPHLPNGELPLFMWKHPSSCEINEVWLVEGALKSLITALKLWFRDNCRTDIMVIGAAGGNFAGSKKTLLEALQSTSCKTIKLQPDAGAVANPHITGNYRKIINSLINDGYECTIGWWGQSTKAFPDIDELESFSNITYLSTFEYKSLCIKWGGIKDNLVDNISQLDYQARVAYEQKKLHSLTYTADYVCDESQKYLPDLVGKIPTSGIVSLVSPKGSGKSTQIKKIKDYCCGYTEEIEIKPEAEPEQLSLLDKNSKQSTATPRPEIKTIRHKGLGMNFVSINARIALGRAQAVQWEFTWIEDADIDFKDEFGSKVSTHSAIENIGEIGCCWDSLGKLFERDWSNTLVVFDEIELGLNHLSTSSTCKERRSFILKTLEVKLKECLENGGLVVVADADFTDISYDYLKAITGHTLYIVKHDFKGDPWEIDFYTGKRDLLLTQIEDWVSNENCEPIAIALDNQKECEALYNYLIKKYPYLKKKIGGLIRIDSKITQTDFGKDFVKHTVKRIEEYKPKILMFTPSLGVGCDIYIKYFKHVFGLFYGNLEPSQARQMLARVREAVPRSVWCKDRANNSTDTPSSYLPSEIKKRLFNNHSATTEFIELALELARERAKASLGLSNPEDKELLPFLQEQLQFMMGDGGWDNPHVDLYCKQIARRNYSLNQLAVQLRQELIDEGHELIDVAIDEATVTGDSVRFEKDEIKHQKAEATAKAEDISVEEALSFKNKPFGTEEENHKATKALLKRELPGVELTADFLYKAVYKDDRRWLSRVKLFWMAKNPSITKKLDSNEWRKKLKQFSSGVSYLPDVKTYSHKVEVIEKIKLLDFLNPLEEFAENSPSIQQFFFDCLRHKKKLQYAFGIHITKNTYPMKLLNRLLEKIGLRMVHSRTVQHNGVKIRYYKLSQNDFYDTNRLAVIYSLDEKFTSSYPETPLNQSQQAEQPRQNLDIYLYNNETSVCNQKPEIDVIQDVEHSPSDTTQRNEELLRGTGEKGDNAQFEQVNTRKSDNSEHINEVSADLEPNDGDSTPIKTSLTMLREAIVGGVEAVFTTISSWTSERRWCAVLLLEEVAASELRNLEQMIPGFYTWLGEFST
ncbi:MAG: plasmid replication protein, CyRepA1 family [Rivularia sp. (in: cyanobacteria)]